MHLHVWFVGCDEPVEVRMDTEVENADALGILLSQARWLAVDGGRLINLANVRMMRLLQGGASNVSSVAASEARAET